MSTDSDQATLESMQPVVIPSTKTTSPSYHQPADDNSLRSVCGGLSIDGQQLQRHHAEQQNIDPCRRCFPVRNQYSNSADAVADGPSDHLLNRDQAASCQGRKMNATDGDREWYCRECGYRVTLSPCHEREYGHDTDCEHHCVYAGGGHA